MKRNQKPPRKRVDPAQLQRYRDDPIAFIDEVLINPETGQPFVLLEAETAFLRIAFRRGPNGRLLHPEMVYSAIKKSGKTVFGAIFLITIIVLFGERYSEGYCVANDYEQAQGRVFEMVKRIITASPLLKREAKISADKIVFPATGATITALASNYASAAGGHPTIAIFDELWGYVSERSHRLWDELVPVPTRKVSCRLVVSHAGFGGESAVLEELYKRGLAQPEVGTDLYAGDGMLMFWSHVPIAPWQDEAWLAQMRRTLRPNQYLRMIENRFVTSESSFIDLARWDACVEPNMHPVIEDKALPIWVGVDASHKHDHTAILCVARDGQRLRLVTHRIFKPDPNDPIDFEAAIEATLVSMAKRFSVQRILFDPWQMQSTAQRLTKRGLPIKEFPQTAGNLTEASQNLYDLIQGRNLIMYEFEDLRLAISRAVAVETSRGWRISKEKQSHKIDAVVALAMACHAVVNLPEPEVIPFVAAFAASKTSGVISEGFVHWPTGASEPPAAPRAETDSEHMNRINDSARASIPSHYLKSGPALGWSAGLEQRRSMRDRWSVPDGW